MRTSDADQRQWDMPDSLGQEARPESRDVARYLSI
jgi:hypothetical protein